MKPTDIVIAPEPGQLFAGIPPGVALDQADGFGIIGLSLEIIEQFFITYGIQGIQMTQRPQPPGFIFQSFLQHQVYIAKKFESTGINIEDLISIGTIGLIKAVNTFSPEKNIKLATYASRCIENEILMYLRKNQNRRREISIDEPLNIDWDGNELLLSDVLGTEPDVVSSGIERESERLMLYQAIAGLEERERSIMELRFGLQKGGREHTQKEVADMIGISQSYISRLEKRIIRRLQKDLRRMNRENREEN